jgi:two-component system sensor histidine kinase/response regulator
MGGDIQVQSAAGRGSTFRFDAILPLVSEDEVLTETRRVLRLAPGQRAPRMLVVDDIADNRTLLARLLLSIGCDVREAVDGGEAVKLWQSWAPDLIWMDLRMPIMDGDEATRRIRSLEVQNAERGMQNEEEVREGSGQQDRANSGTESILNSAFRTLHSKIIAVSASAFEHERNALIEAGCDDFVTKPFREEKIFEKVAQHLGVEFEYEQPGPAEFGPVDVGVAWDSMALLPAELLAELKSACMRASVQGAGRAIQRIRELNPQVADKLGGLVREFSFDRILEIIEPAGREGDA